MPAEPPIDVPRRLFEAYELLAAGHDAGAAPVPIAGATDLMVQISGELGEPPARLLDLSRLEELRGIALDRGTLILGAATTYAEIRRSTLCREHLPALVECAATVGAAQIQNRGTLGGNLGTASPAGDTLPILLATDALVLVGGQRGERRIPATEFFIGYRQTALAPDELILHVEIPMRPGRHVRFRKVGTRRAQAISKIVVTLAWRDPGGASGPWADVRLALGSGAPIPIRPAATEGVLEGSRPTPEVADRAAAVLAGELSPIDDVRSTADYRRIVAARVLHRLLREAGGW